MKQSYRVPMKCAKPKCPNWYFGWWPKDENKLCFQCREAKEKRDKEWMRITTAYLKTEGKDRL